MPLTTEGNVELIACQMVSSVDIDENFAQVDAQLSQWAKGCASPSNESALVVLPECFALFGGDATLNLRHQETLGDGPIQSKLSQLAIKYKVWLVGGTIPVKTHDPERFFASSTVYNPQGVQVADYQKIHLFDVDVADNTGAYRESDTTAPGQRVVIFDMQGITVGVAVCYDVRFPGLFQRLAAQGAQIIVLPSAFTEPTGQAHWHTLLRARAIENQLYMVAAGQGGTHANGRQTYGHSLIVDPWGEVLAEKNTGPGWVSTHFEQALIDKVRRNMPIHKHNRFTNELTQ